jgi:hypothetical protein
MSALRQPVRLQTVLVSAVCLLILSETVLAGSLRAGHVPFRSALLSGLAFALLAVPALYRRSVGWIPVLAVMAVAGKSLAIPLYHLSLSCGANAGLALLLHGAALTGPLALAARRPTAPKLVAAGAAAGLLSAPLFFLTSGLLAPCSGMLRIQALTGGLGAFWLSRGIPWALAGALLVPLAWLVVRRIPVAAGARPLPLAERLVTAMSLLLALAGIVVFGSALA